MNSKKEFIWWSKKKVGTVDTLSNYNIQTTDVYTLLKNENNVICTKPSWQVEADMGSFRKSSSVLTDLDAVISDSSWFFESAISFSNLLYLFVGLFKLLFLVTCIYILFLFFRYIILLSTTYLLFLCMLFLCSTVVFLLYIFFLQFVSFLIMYLFTYTSIIMIDESIIKSVLESTRSLWCIDFEFFNSYCSDNYLSSSSIYDFNTDLVSANKNILVSSSNETDSINNFYFEHDYYIDSNNRSVCFNLLLDLYDKKETRLNLCGEYKNFFYREKYFPLVFHSDSSNKLVLNRLIELSGHLIPTLTHKSVFLNMNADSRFLIFNTLFQLYEYSSNIYSTMLYKYFIYNFFISSSYIDACHSNSKESFEEVLYLLQECYILITKLNLGDDSTLLDKSFFYLDTTHTLLPQITKINFSDLSALSNSYLSRRIEADSSILNMCSSLCRSYIHNVMYNLPFVHDYYKLCHFSVARLSLSDYSLPIYKIALSNYKDIFPSLHENIKLLSGTPFAIYMQLLFDQNTWLEQIDLRLLLRSPFFIDCITHIDARHNYLFLCYYKKLLIELNRDIILGTSSFFPNSYYSTLSSFCYNSTFLDDSALYLFPCHDIYTYILDSRNVYEHFFLEKNNLLYRGQSFDYYHHVLNTHFIKKIVSFGLDKTFCMRGFIH